MYILGGCLSCRVGDIDDVTRMIKSVYDSDRILNG
jgi:hypothetical protein